MRIGVGTTLTILVIVRSIGEEPAELPACRRRGAAGVLVLVGAAASAAAGARPPAGSATAPLGAGERVAAARER